MFLYTFKYFNKYYKEEMECEFSGFNEKDAKLLAVTRLNEVDKKYLDSLYVIEDFTLVSIDKTIIKMTNLYKTRDGRKVVLSKVGGGTTSYNQVVGKIYDKDPKGGFKKKGHLHLWSINGRTTVGICETDLIQI